MGKTVAQELRGSAKFTLTGPLQQEQMDKCKLEARTKLKPALVDWLDVQRGQIVDTSNRLFNLQFEAFLDTCLSRAGGVGAFKDRFWTFTYTLMPEGVDAAIAAHNAGIVLRTEQSWSLLQAAVEKKNLKEIYHQSVRIIAFATGYIGTSTSTQGNTCTYLLGEARGILKQLMEKVVISSDGQLIEGKPGFQPITAPLLTVTIDGTPFPGLILTGTLPGGVEIFSDNTDKNGSIALLNMIIPYISNGAMMYVAPNPGRVIDRSANMGLKDFGIASGSDQTFFFKIAKPTYTLNYKMTATDPDLALPKDMASGASTISFLADSCYMQKILQGTPDLAITINCTVISKSDEMDFSEARFRGTVSIQTPSTTPAKKETETIDFANRYDKVEQAPMGTFLWDSNRKMQKAIQKILRRL
jgi:hypothetical protein